MPWKVQWANDMAGRLEIPMLWYTSFRALFGACERERPTYERGREGGGLRGEELERGLLSPRINTEQGMGRGKSANHSMLRARSPNSPNIVTTIAGQTEAPWW